MDRIPELRGEIERLRAVRWAQLTRDATDDDDEDDHAVLYLAEPIHSGYVLIKRGHLGKRDQPGARAVEAGARRADFLERGAKDEEHRPVASRPLPLAEAVESAR